MARKNEKGVMIGRPSMTLEQKLEIAEKLERYIETKEVPSISGFCAQIGVSRQYLHNHPDFDYLREKLLTKKEAALEEKALAGEVNTGMAIFSLKQLGWSDRVDHHHDGEVGHTFVVKLPQKMTEEEWRAQVEQKRLEDQSSN